MTGPTTRKMVINALNSGAKAWMADFEDATSPSWFNVVDGQINLYDAIRRQIDFTDDKGKRYEVGETTPTIMVRPRGWHLDERHLTLDGVPVPGAFVDFGLYFFHNAQTLITNGAGPYFYLPKMESHLEARLWNDVFSYAEERLEIPYGTIRATCLIETTPAAFEMEEILYELRDHSSGLNAGRWDYIFSMIKNFAEDRRSSAAGPQRGDDDLARSWPRTRTCWSRPATRAVPMRSAGWPRSCPAGTIPKRQRPRWRRRRPTSRGRREPGFDGSWVAHPALVETCTTAFTEVLGDRPNQLEKQRDDVTVVAEDLIDVSTTVRLADGGRGPDQHPGQPRVPGGLGRRRGCGGDRQPDGGRRHGGDLPDAGLAVRPAQCDRRRRNGDHRRPGAADDAGGGGEARVRAPTSGCRAWSTRRRTSSSRPAWSPIGRSSSPTTPTTPISSARGAATLSLRHAEAEARSAQLIITKMIIDLDLTDPSAAHFESETTIHFDATGGPRRSSTSAVPNCCPCGSTA